MPRSLRFYGSSFAGGSAALIAVALFAACGGDDTSTSGGTGGGTGVTSGTDTTSSSGGGSSSTTTATATGTTGSTSATTGAGGGLPFSCLGDPLPTTAPPMITVTGVTATVGLGGQMPVGNVTLDFFVGAAAMPVQTATSNAQGDYTVTLATGDAPVDGYLRGRVATYLDSFLYPPTPLAADTDNATVLLLTQNTFNLLQTLSSASQTAGNAFIGVAVVDCNGDPVAGATVSSNPPGDIRYNENGVPSSSATVTDADGFGFIFNVPPGNVTVDADSGGISLREHVLNARPDVITTTVVLP